MSLGVGFEFSKYKDRPGLSLSALCLWTRIQNSQLPLLHHNDNCKQAPSEMSFFIKVVLVMVSFTAMEQ